METLTWMNLASHSEISVALRRASSASFESEGGRGSFWWWSQYSRTLTRTLELTLGRGMASSEGPARSCRQLYLARSELTLNHLLDEVGALGNLLVDVERLLVRGHEGDLVLLVRHC